jgi:outer membrane protein
MKRIIIAMAAFLCMSAGLNAQAQKIAFVNTTKVIDTLPQKDTAELKLQQYSMLYENQLAEMEQEFNTKKAEFDKEASTAGVSAIRLELLQKNLQNMYKQLTETEQAMQNDLQLQRANLLNPIIEEIKKAVSDVAKAKGYTSAIDNSQGLVLYIGNTNDDITDAVIKHMLAPKPATPAAPKK